MMRIPDRSLLLSLLLAPLVLLLAARVHAAAGSVVATDNVKAWLVGETRSIAPGQSVWVALDLDIRDGWHTYWKNPGDSGQATRLIWTLPAGVTAGDIVWTAPHRFELPPLVNYGYAHQAMHLVEIKAASDLKPGTTLALAAKASWLVCADVCIPESADLKLALPVTAQPGPLDPGVEPLFIAARAALPRAAPAAASARVAGGQLRLELGPEWRKALPADAHLAFYPLDEGSIEYAAPQTLTLHGDTTELAMKPGDQPVQSGAVHGLLIAGSPSGNAESPIAVFEITAPLTASDGTAVAAPRFAPAGVASAPAGVAGARAGTAAGPTASADSHSAAVEPPASLALLALFAVLGGLVLNLMPCVFPVLSIKAIGLVEQAKKHPAAVRRKGLLFAAGVLASMLTLAGVLLALRAGGEQIGWGFQLQSPLFVTLMIYLLLAVGLNLSGVFEVGGGLSGVGDSLTHGDSDRASFFTGVLTTLVATPCTAPFMAAAVGAALTASPLAALLIFAALGVGLSLPFLLISFAPWMRRILPKPGAWMDTLKQMFAFPMYASAAWLLWVLAQQTSSFGLAAALAGAVLIGLAGWSYQKSKSSSGGKRAAALLTASAAVVLALTLPVRFAQTAQSAALASASTAAGEGWQPYDPAQLAEITAAGRPVLVNFTASWCLTCLVNERNAFADPAVEHVFRTKGVTLMKGDWTNRDPVITQALSAFGRAGVPLYVVYNSKPGESAAIVLPQLLTASIVADTFAALPDRAGATAMAANARAR
jgi:thiol:disulfide interchange protein DsbD